MAGSLILKALKKKLVIKNLTGQTLPIGKSKIEKIISKILKNLAIADKTRRASIQELRWTIGVVFLTNSDIQKLNKRYLKRNRPTDVLAFNYSKSACDLAISLEMAKKNAEVYKTSFKKELILYIIHGFLHVFGYNDDTLKNKKRMFRKQEEMFRMTNVQ